jgi:hypothetical protein
VITALKRGLLWQLSGRQPLRVAVTPPGAPDQYGLATALCDLLAESGVPVRLKFMRGAQRRLKALSNNEADVATLSKQAQQSLSEEWQGELAAVEGGPVQYYNPSLLIVVERGKQRKERPVRRVGIDRDSPDHVALTEAEFAGMNVEFVDCRFIEVPTAILLGEIDAGVWHRRLTLIPPELAGLKVRPMRNTGVLVSSSDIVSAVLCFQAKDSACEAVLREIDMSRVRAMQDEFLAQDLGADELDSRLWVR